MVTMNVIDVIDQATGPEIALMIAIMVTEGLVEAAITDHLLPEDDGDPVHGLVQEIDVVDDRGHDPVAVTGEVVAGNGGAEAPAVRDGEVEINTVRRIINAKKVHRGPKAGPGPNLPVGPGVVLLVSQEAGLVAPPK